MNSSSLYSTGELRSGRLLLSVVVPVASARADQKKIQGIISAWNVSEGSSVADRGSSGAIEVVVVIDGTDRGPNRPRFSSEPETSRTRLVYAERRLGPGGARNLGAAEAVGEFLYFCDDDDVPDPLVVIKCAHDASRLKSLVGAFGCSITDRRSRISRVQTLIPRPGHDRMSRLVQRQVGIWRFVIARRVFADGTVRFPEWDYGEDLAVAVHLMQMQDACTTVTDIGYHHQIHEPTSGSVKSSITRLLLHTAVGLHASPRVRVTALCWLFRIQVRTFMKALT